MKLIPKFKYHNFSRIHILSLFYVLFSLMITNVYAQKSDDFVVVLDAGHGGHDVGCGGKHGTKFEKDVALSIVLKTGRLLEEKKNVKVIYTRKKDVFVDLWKRGDIANEADADLFVSVHCNSNTSARPFGSETYVLSLKGNDKNFKIAKSENEVILLEDNHKERYQGFDPSNPTSLIGLSLEQEENLDQSLLLASLIQSDFENSLKRYNRGVKQAAFWVLHRSYMPSVLVETGFLSNRNEGKFLSGSDGQKQVSESLAKSIYKYYEQQQLNVAINDYAIPSLPAEEPEVNVERSNTFYKVQLASSKNKLRTYSYNFKGLKNVERVKVGELYKYYLGTFNTKKEAEDYLSLAKSKGYKTAFVVDFKNENDTEIAEEAIVKAVEVKKDQIYFKVQIASSSKKISTKPSNFKGLKEVKSVKVGDYYKYYLGKTEDYEKAKDYLSSAKSKGYQSAFIAAFYKDERITLKEALKRQTN